MAEKVELLTQTEFAERVGVSGPRINQLARRGRLKLAPDGKRIVWPESRDLFYAERGIAPPAPGAPPVRPSRSEPAPSSRRPGAPDDEPASPATSTARLTAAKARKEAAKARLAELDLAEREGSLIPLEEVQADATAVFGAARAALLSLPSRAALRCEQRSAAEVEAILGDLVNEILTDGYRGRFLGAANE